MIRLRCLFERGCAHPVLGRVLLLVLVLMLALLFLHFAEDGHGAESFGALCVALAAIWDRRCCAIGTPKRQANKFGSNRPWSPTLILASRLRMASGPDPPLSLPLRR